MPRERDERAENGADAIGPGEKWRERKNPQERKCMRERKRATLCTKIRGQRRRRKENARQELSAKCCPAGQRPCIIICPWHSSDETGSLVAKMKNVITLHSFKAWMWPGYFILVESIFFHHILYTRMYSEGNKRAREKEREDKKERESDFRTQLVKSFYKKKSKLVQEEEQMAFYFLNEEAVLEEIWLLLAVQFLHP